MDVKGNKKGLGLAVKIMLLVLLPIAIMAVFAIIVLRSAVIKTADSVIEDELNLAVYSLQTELDVLADGAYLYDGENLYKGEYNITADMSLLDNFKKETGVDVTIFIGGTRRATSLIDKSGSRMVGTDANADIIEAVYNKGGTYKASGVKIMDYEYYVMYKPLIQPGSGEIVGMLFAGIDNNDVTAVYSSVLATSVVFIVVILILSVATGVIFIVILIKAISGIVGNLDRIADGYMNTEIGNKLVVRKDEIGNIARAVRALLTKVSSAITKVLRTSKDLEGCSEDFYNSFTAIHETISGIDTAVNDIATGATSQAGETQKVNEDMVSMGSAIDSTSKNIKSLKDSTGQMSKINKTVGETLDSLVEITKDTQKSIEDIKNQTDVTNQSAVKIREATALIADISNQTNLLSLNASIEAARAGEHGRGFAVVADEIRQLAEQSRVATERIGEIVDNLITNSDMSVDTMDKVMAVINEQGGKLNDTQGSFNKLNGEIVNVGNAVDNISAEVTNLNEFKHSVLEGVESLAAISEEYAASTQETSASMTQLREYVDRCMEMTEQIRSMSGELADVTSHFKFN